MLLYAVTTEPTMLKALFVTLTIAGCVIGVLFYRADVSIQNSGRMIAMIGALLSAIIGINLLLQFDKSSIGFQFL